ncbi:hypothetical protein FQN54_001942 [Arachnomyces sp. PD_36]|nr:hypothetical protein FQN54_001942 [Arachnomyces sp. PD_36]
MNLLSAVFRVGKPRLSPEHIPLPDPPLESSARPILKLPLDVLPNIVDRLSPAETAALALSSKAILNAIGTHVLKIERFEDRLELLQHLQILYPQHLLCYQCGRFHLRRNKIHEPEDDSPCDQKNGRYYFNGSSIPFTAVQQVMNRHLYGEDHGMPVENLFQRQLSNVTNNISIPFPPRPDRNPCASIDNDNDNNDALFRFTTPRGRPRHLYDPPDALRRYFDAPRTTATPPMQPIHPRGVSDWDATSVTAIAFGDIVIGALVFWFLQWLLRKIGRGVRDQLLVPMGWEFDRDPQLEATIALTAALNAHTQAINAAAAANGPATALTNAMNANTQALIAAITPAEAPAPQG